MSPENPPVDAAREKGSPVANAAVDAQLERILSSERFQKSRRLAEFLRFVVEETLIGRADFIKARNIAIRVFDRDLSASPENDPIVRIQAGRLRRALNQYYEHEGSTDPVLIEIPKGAYVPVFSLATKGHDQKSEPLLAHTVSSGHQLPRIAVLPLVNLGDTSQSEYFADGLAEELSMQLARCQGLAVLAYWTTSQIRGTSRDVLKAGRELAVDFLVCGSVARNGDRIRVSIQCVDVQTGDQIWSAPFDRRMTVDGLFEIQDEIVEQVVACVGDSYGSIPQTLFRASRGKPISELTAYEAILANHYYVRRLDQETRSHTQSALERAVEIEPTYARAWAMLGALYCDIHAYDRRPDENSLARGEDCVRHAMALDRDCQHAHYASAYVGALTRDHARIIAACDNIVRLNPNAAFMVGAASIWLGIAGHFDRAVPLFERSLELNPYHPGWFHFLPWLQAFAEQDYERALAAAHQFNMPTFFWDPLVRAACLGRLGRDREAALAYQEVLNIRPEFAASASGYIGCYIHHDDTREEMLDGLHVAGLR